MAVRPSSASTLPNVAKLPSKSPHDSPQNPRTAVTATNTNAVNANNLETWQDAFATLPLPGLRRLESQLRTQISEHRSRLRTLVGAHYRDLLGTADRIVDMHEQTRRMERILGENGRKCNAAVLERGVRNVGTGRVGGGGASNGQDAERRKKELLVGRKLLRSAMAGAKRIVRAEGDALLAAKMVVLARLLLKTLEERVKESSKIKEGRGLADTDSIDQGEREDVNAEVEAAEQMKRRVAAARKMVLRYISWRLGLPGMDLDDTVAVLCAYSLITSSASGDVLRFFLQVRLQQIEATTEIPGEDKLIQTLDLYRRTRSEVKELFPRRFAEGMAKLSSTALVRDTHMRQAIELSLDIYDIWISEDIQHYTPWFRQDQLSASEVRTIADSWANEARECLLHGVTESLKSVTDAGTALQFRYRFMQDYLSLGTEGGSSAYAQSIRRMSNAFVARLEALARSAAAVGALSFQSNNLGYRSQPMWEMAATDISIDNGALKFRKDILQRQRGASASTQGPIVVLDDWTARLQEFSRHIASMKGTKWDNNIEIDFDEMESGNEILAILSEADPGSIKAKLCESTLDTLRQVYSLIGDEAASGTDAAFLLRITREVDKRRRTLGDVLEDIEGAKADDGVIMSLQHRLANTLVEDSLRHQVVHHRSRDSEAVTLWDGTPPLPVHLSPGIFRLLVSLHRAMSSLGDDLWSPGVVHTLHDVLASRIESQLEPADASSPDLQAAKDPSSQANEDTEDIHETRRVHLLQQLFDLLYLERIMTAGDVQRPPETLTKLIEHALGQLQLEEGVVDRMKKHATDFWRKTYLLLGLLAPKQK